MRKIVFLLITMTVVLSSCSPRITKSSAYKGIYKEKPVTLLIMPPINRSTNVEAKEYFHSTLLVPLANSGYYIIPPILSMEILKRESAYDAELFVNSSLKLFEEIFGADVALFTIIHKWKKSGISAKVDIDVEYIFKSTKTDKVLYTRRANVIYDTSVSSGMGGLAGALVNVTATVINTAATKEINVARICNTRTFEDLPVGKYSPDYLKDGEGYAGPKSFKVNAK